MVEGAERMSCGACACKTFSIYQTDRERQLHVECTKCKSVTVVSVPAIPRLDIDWGEGSEGILCVLSSD